MAKISVVMAVYNGAATLAGTMESILAQTERDFELVVVDDGSTDQTPALLMSYAQRDPRVRVISQANTGLTRALMRGCDEATAEIVARHDCGDRSHPERLRKQHALLQSDAELVLVSCDTAYLGPGGERLYVASGDGERVRHSLLHDGVAHIRGLTHHGTAMFRREAYTAAGCYRPQFRVAQDLDLWVRMAKLGAIAFVPEVLYEARIEVNAISAHRRTEQIESARIALALRDTPDEAARKALLDQADTIAMSKRRHHRRSEARTLYFIASCLRRERHPGWRSYARQALGRDPLLFRAWFLLLRPRR
ncbi:MAG TPA: glycosyltransferase family 2 protein [Thermoanaerobaculia bacterium]|nr:glycosyltransferase family 2 protein [Thermoanaerobaculia bacterium]